MNIGILGTGMVGRAHAAKLVENGHEVMIGTRDPAETLARTKPDYMGNAPLSEWWSSHPRVRVGTFEQAAGFGDFVINATLGSASVSALWQAGPETLAGKILIDIANSLHFTEGGGATLSISSSDSLGERLQRLLPKTRVIKTLNMVGAPLQVSPALTGGGDHHAFVSGNDPEAKAWVIRFLQEQYGWRHVLDLGDISSARAAEMLMPMWIQLFGRFRSPMFGFKIVGLPGEG